MRVCFIGDSHLGHIKTVWDERQGSHPDWQVGFRVERTYGTEPLVIHDGDQHTRFEDITLAFSPDVDVRNWDAFVVFGMHYSAAAIAKVYPKFRSDAHAASPKAYVLSEAAFEEGIMDLLRATKAGRVLATLQALSAKPILYVQQPNPLAWVRQRTEPKMRHFGRLSEAGDHRSLSQLHGAGLDELEERGIAVLRQPAETKEDEFFTQDRYGLADPADTSEDSSFSKGDYFHMNAEYGRLVMDQLEPWLAGVAGE